MAAECNLLDQVRSDTTRCRNVCIVAHVDHGKTTLADSLVASNGIISQRLAGELRYLDSRSDEQERGITMKSSAITLQHHVGDTGYLVNLLDSPGHVDFSGEVSTAVRLCDGAIVVVDAVEGICSQTQTVLRQVWLEGIRPVLLINKIDRLFVELQLNPAQAYQHLHQLLGQVNAAVGQLFLTDVFANDEMANGYEGSGIAGIDVSKWSLGLDDIDDSSIYFSPEEGNVIFASVIDKWAFDLSTFAAIYSQRLGIPAADLQSKLWGDFYLNQKKKLLETGAAERGKKPLFVQFVMENLAALYDALQNNDGDRLLKIAEALNVKVPPREVRNPNLRLRLRAVFGLWLPVSNAVLDSVVRHIPSPRHLSEDRVIKLLSTLAQPFASLPTESQRLKDAFLAADPQSDVTIAFVSKLFPITASTLPQNRRRVLTTGELTEMRENVLKKREQLTTEEGAVVETVPEPAETSSSAPVLLALTRVFSGTLREGQRVFVLEPKYCVSGDRTEHMREVELGEMFLLKGRELQSLKCAAAGMVCGIRGLDGAIVKSGTLSTTLDCPAFAPLHLQTTPIFQVAVEPTKASDTADLSRGLELLSRSDSCVEVGRSNTGEWTLAAAGEVHLQKCLADIRDWYPALQLKVSPPIVPFRETLVPPPTVDMTDELITDVAAESWQDDDEVIAPGHVQVEDAGVEVDILLEPLAEDVTLALDHGQQVLRALHAAKKSTIKADELKDSVQLLRQRLESCESVKGKVILATGPKHCGCNLLVTEDTTSNSPMWDISQDDTAIREVDWKTAAAASAFQLFTGAGPIAGEPVRGVLFSLRRISIMSEHVKTGHLVHVLLEAMRKAFQTQPRRLMMCMYSCEILATQEALGKCYTVIGRRFGQVTREQLRDGSQLFAIEAQLPVVESFDFAEELRKKTSGGASPVLRFSHYQVLDIDPYWVPRTEEELLHFGEKADSENRARRYMNWLRRRKGLVVDEKVVQHGDKQRNLGKNK